MICKLLKDLPNRKAGAIYNFSIDVDSGLVNEIYIDGANYTYCSPDVDKQIIQYFINDGKFDGLDWFVPVKDEECKHEYHTTKHSYEFYLNCGEGKDDECKCSCHKGENGCHRDYSCIGCYPWHMNKHHQEKPEVKLPEKIELDKFEEAALEGGLTLKLIKNQNQIINYLAANK